MVGCLAAPNPPRLVYSPAYRIHGHRGSTIAIPARAASLNVHQPVIAEWPVIQEQWRNSAPRNCFERSAVNPLQRARSPA